MAQYENDARAIASNIQSGNCVVFVGAGLSVEAGLPGWDDLTSDILRDLNLGPTEADSLGIAQAYAELRSRQALTDKLRRLLDCSGTRPTALHIQLSRLNVDVWVTTNFDDLLERALKCVPSNVVVDDEDYAHFRPAHRMVLKLHGDLTRPDSIVITKNDYIRGPVRSAAKWHHITHLLEHRSFVFLGYSLRDTDFDQVQAKILQHLGPDKMRDSYAVLFDVDPVRVADLKSRKVNVVDLGVLKAGTRAAAMTDFIEMITQNLTIVSSAGLERHDGVEGLIRVPPEIVDRVSKTDWDFVCCLECVLYNPFDDYVIQSSGPVSIPNEFRRDGFHRELYLRTTPDVGWAGSAIWKRRRVEPTTAPGI